MVRIGELLDTLRDVREDAQCLRDSVRGEAKPKLRTAVGMMEKAESSLIEALGMTAYVWREMQ